MGDVTTMKISTATRDRLKALGNDGDSLEDVVVAALEVYEAEQFWAQAESATRAETAAERDARRRSEADIDAWMDELA
jgi:hypothetical protein